VTQAAQLPFPAVEPGEIIEGIAAARARSDFIVVDACRNTPSAATSSKHHPMRSFRGPVMGLWKSSISPVPMTSATRFAASAGWTANAIMPTEAIARNCAKRNITAPRSSRQPQPIQAAARLDRAKRDFRELLA
jgi:hypothetical protein